MNITIMSPLDNQPWDTFVKTCPDSTIFHCSAWARLISQTYGYEPRYYVKQNDDGVIRAGIPLFVVKKWPLSSSLVGLPFSDTGAILTQSPVDTAELLEVVRNDLKKNHYQFLEIREKSGSYLSEIDSMQRLDIYSNFVLDLDKEPERLRQEFERRTIQSSIRKAEQSDLTCKIVKDEDDLASFYHLNILTRRKHGVPPQPYRFFVNLWRTFHPLNVIELILCYHDSHPIAGVILLRFKDTMYYKYCASDSRFLRLRPNHFLVWKGIELACQEGFKYFDFGRTDKNNEGLMEFKSRWGTKEVPLTYYYFPEIRGVNAMENKSRVEKLAKLALQRMPLPINRLFGELAYKYFA